MIGWLNGVIVDKQVPGKLVIDVNGVGYDVETSLQTFLQLENQREAVGLFIHTVVREDALLLYGFLAKEERALFRTLIKVNGIGPKMAIAILSSVTPNEFIRCINQQNISLLIKLPGIGKKTAERLLIEMKDSLQNHSNNSPAKYDFVNPSRAQDEAIKALEALGYRSHEAINTLAKIDNGQQTCEELLRGALQSLGGT